MAKRYEPYAYVDLSALRDAASGEAGLDHENVAHPDASSSCRGKVLLLVSASGIELVRVPSVLH